jgi:hypothetical protein
MWAGHVVRMEGHRIVKKVLGSCFGEERPVGRQRNRCGDVIQRDAGNLRRIRNWKAVERDVEEGGWGGHGLKTGRNAIEEEEINK